MDLPNPPLLTTNGSYELEVIPGQAYLQTLKGTFGGATVTMTTESDVVPATFDPVTDGAFTADSETDFRAPSSTLRYTVTNATGSTAIRLTVVRHNYDAQ